MAEAKQEHADDKTNELFKISRNLEQFNLSGELPTLGHVGKSSLLENLLAMVFAPIASPAFFIVSLSEVKQYRLHRIVHTEWRKDDISKFAIMLSSNLLLLGVAILFIISRSPLWGYIIITVTGLGIVAAIAEIAVAVWGQNYWKDFWQIRLLEVMAVAGKQDNHDLFNRAMILKGYVESQPDIPIPGNLGFYGLIYSGIQAILLILSKAI